MYAYKEKSVEQKKRVSDQTGIPARMKAQFEAASGFSLDDVKVHYNSQKPIQMQAFAYTQGRNVYLGPGQERHLPHELGHVVQQKRRFIPTTDFIAGKEVNTEKELEVSADQFAQKALQSSSEQGDFQNKGVTFEQPIQCLRISCESEERKEQQRELNEEENLPQKGLGEDEMKSQKGEIVCESEGEEEQQRDLEEEQQEDSEEFQILTQLLEQEKIEVGEDRVYKWDELPQVPVNFPEKLRDYVKKTYGSIQETAEKKLEFKVNYNHRNYTVKIEPEEWYVFFNGMELLKEMDSSSADEVRWIGMPCIASGDQFSVLAAMLLDPKLCLRIYTYEKKEEQEQQGNENSLFNFLCGKLGCKKINYSESGVIEVRKRLSTNQVIQLVRAKAYERIKGEKKVQETTEIVAKRYNRETRNKFREIGGLEANEEKDEKLVAWLNQRWHGLSGLIDENHKFFILWFRFSGRRGEAHPEHDTSFGAMRLLIGELLKGDSLSVILLAGDNYKGKAGKLTEGQEDKVFDMTEFWKSESETKGGATPESSAAKLNDWGGEDRIGQMRVYDYIQRKAKSVIHIGSRSGNLELLSLIGHKVIYMEEKNSIGGERMEAYSKRDKKIPMDSPDRLNYTRMELQKPLTFKGRLVRNAMEQINEMQKEVETLKKNLEATEKKYKAQCNRIKKKEGYIKDLLGEADQICNKYKNGSEEIMNGSEEIVKELDKLEKIVGKLERNVVEFEGLVNQSKQLRSDLEKIQLEYNEKKDSYNKRVSITSDLRQKFKDYRQGMLTAMEKRETEKISEIREDHNLKPIIDETIVSISNDTDYKTNSYPELPDFDFSFRKFLEALFMFIATLKKKELAEEQASKKGESSPSGKFEKPDGWYAGFIESIQGAINRYNNNSES